MNVNGVYLLRVVTLHVQLSLQYYTARFDAIAIIYCTYQDKYVIRKND